MRAVHTRLPVCLVFLGLLPMLGCAEDSVTDRFELTGLVVNEQSNAPIAGAQVRFESDTLMRSDAVTDEAGQYEMVVVTDTPFGQVKASRDGFVPGESTVFFDTPLRRVDLRLRPE